MGDIVIYHGANGDCPAIVLADLAGGLLDLQAFSLIDGIGAYHDVAEGTSMGEWSERA